jgi:hypothetical protein
VAADLAERVQRCPNFVSYDSLNGPVVYCQIAAFAGRIHAGQLRLIGCTDELRAACARQMELACGFSAVPVLEKPARTEELVATAQSRVGGEA